MGRYTLAEKKQPRYTLADESDQKPMDQVESQPQESQGWRGVGSDLLQKIGGIPGGLLSMAMKAPSEVYGLGKQAVSPLWGEEPRLPKNLLKGGYEALNTPANIMDYFGRKGFTRPVQDKNELQNAIMGTDKKEREPISGEKLHLPELNWGLGEKQAGDELAQSILPMIAPGGLGTRLTRGLIEHLPSVRPSAIAHELSANKRAVQQAASHDYNQYFQDAARHGVTEVPVPHIAQEHLLHHMTGAQHGRLEHYIENPTFENAHWAQSELGYFIRHMEDIQNHAKTSGGLGPERQLALREARQARDRIRTAMHEQSGLAGHPELEHRYHQLAHNYGENVVPYGRLGELTEHEERRMSSGNLVKSLLKNDEFMLGLGRQYHGMKAHEFVHSPLGKLIIGGIVGGKAFDIGKSLLK